MSDERKVWVVSGTCGEYSDRSTWLVSAHATEDDANAEAARLTAAFAVERAKLDEADQHDWETYRKAKDAMEAAMREVGDVGFMTDYSGTDYYVTAVPAKFAQAFNWVQP